MASTTHVYRDSIDFGPLRYDYTICIPYEYSLLDGLDFCVAADRSAADRSSLSDLRVYVESTDITSSLIEALVELIESMDGTIWRTQYATGIESWFKVLSYWAERFDTINVEADQALAKRLLNESPSILLRQLGDLACGWNGHLHVFNYLYTLIELPPISLLNVLDRHNKKTGGKLDISRSNKLRLTFSCGVCRLFEPAKWTGQPAPSGCVRSEIRVVQRNPLDEILDDISARLAIIEAQLSTSGPLYSLMTSAIREPLQILASRIDACNAQIGDYNNIRAVSDSLREIKRALGLPD